MADRIEKDRRLFERVARQRLKAAWYLFEDEAKEFNLDAVYLGGYAVECALKALILKQTARTDHVEIMEKLTEVGALAHDFEYLKSLLKTQQRKQTSRDRQIFGKLTSSFQKVGYWSTAMRYQVGFLKTREALSFLNAAQEIVDWCLRG